jgi:hypothetical protein
MTGQHCPDFLRSRQCLVQLHARTARVGENRVHAFSFEGGDEDFAPLHRRADFGAFDGRGFFRFDRRLAHVFVRLWPEIAGKQKTHDRCQPWVIVEIALSATSPGGIVSCDDHHQRSNLQRP